MNPGDIAWVGTATALVMVMTPALGFFYAGLVRAKNLVSTLVQCLIIFAVVSLVWVLWGYSLSFAPSLGGLGIIGDLSHFALNGVGLEPDGIYTTGIPVLLFFAFQLKFAAITPALIIGSFAERIKFKALLIFSAIWATVIYSPIAHWVWNPEGWLGNLGAIDFAGGTVVHISAGLSALAAALVIGRREGIDSEEPTPSNIPYVILGTALLWFGWFGFNAGSSLAADGVAVIAMVSTNTAAAAAGVTWMMVDWVRKGKPSAVGFCVGAVCGLVAITPGSGYVTVTSAIIIGVVVGMLSNTVANWRATRTKIDDSLDVFACHGVGGIWGALATGLFATLAVNPGGANGLFYGNPGQLTAQIIAIVVVGLYSFVGSYVILKVVGKITPLRVTHEEEEAGLDMSQHGEHAYALD
ncbi:MAG: ammonium transporter [Candidatus Bathyarchaeota archaeon]|nr:ammonium transporter [Candidatus Bathyarchaeota archaeon]